MTSTRQLTLWVAAAAVAAAAQPAAALERFERPLLLNRAAVSGYYGGYGIPVGEFASSRVGDGNQQSGAEDWAFEFEYFAARTTSLGFTMANTTYLDKTYPDLETHLATYSGFVRTVVPVGFPIRPYLRAGAGGVQVQFQDPVSRVRSDYSWSLQFGGGLLWMPARWLGFSAQALYYLDFTENAYIAANNTIVGFDSKYFVFAGGVSLFFP